MGNAYLWCCRCMKCFAVIGLLLFSISARSQAKAEQDTTQVAEQDTVIAPQKPVKNLATDFFLEARVEGVPGLGKRNFSQHFGIGLNYKRLTLGVYQNLALGSTSRTLIFPNAFDLKYAFGGVYLGLEVVKSGPVTGSVLMNYGHGDMIWERSTTGDDFLRDTFHMIKPEVRIAYQPIRFFRVYALGGYRTFLDLDLNGVEQSDFSGITFALGIQLGYFHE